MATVAKTCGAVCVRCSPARRLRIAYVACALCKCVLRVRWHHRLDSERYWSFWGGLHWETTWETLICVSKDDISVLEPFLVYAFLIPWVIAKTLMTQRRKGTLYPSQSNYDSRWTMRMGFVFAGYRLGYEWWEAVVMLRKCAFILLSIFLRTSSPLRIYHHLAKRETLLRLFYNITFNFKLCFASIIEHPLCIYI